MQIPALFSKKARIKNFIFYKKVAILTNISFPLLSSFRLAILYVDTPAISGWVPFLCSIATAIDQPQTFTLIYGLLLTQKKNDNIIEEILPEPVR